MWSKHQAVVSRTESHIGLGFVQHIDFNEQTIKVHYPLVEEVKLYSLKTTVLQRYLLRENQSFSYAGKQELVKQVVVDDGIASYLCASGLSLNEYDLEPELEKYLSLIERFIMEPWSDFKAYDLRKQGLNLSRSMAADRLSGPVSSRIRLLPHQLFIADKVSAEERPRAILADEVGLGKTIEAGLILSSLNAIEKANRVLIVVPESLIHQWANELSTLFDSYFVVMNPDRYEQERLSLGISPFESNPRIIISLEDLENSSEKAFEAASLSWDMLIVDEAHHLEWAPGEPSQKWSMVNQIAKESKGLLLLTATPRQKGFATQFGLLHMIDSKRFGNFEDFVVEMELIDSIAKCVKEIKESGKISEQQRKELSLLFEEDTEISKLLAHSDTHNPELLISKLIDRHGTGRVFYRNRKSSLDYFPQRHLKHISLKAPDRYHKALSEVDVAIVSQREMMNYATGRKFGALHSSLQAEEDPKVSWLAQHMSQTKEKIVVICSEMSRVLEVAQKLRVSLGATPDEFNKRVMLFHEGLESIVRDKGAAFFAESDGPQILIASEMGGEGRNFQFVKNLVLFDIPANPEKLEQRVGRLDRIGQGEEIFIYVPVFENTPEQVLFHWYHEGLGAFTEAQPAAGDLLEIFGEQILEVLTSFFFRQALVSNKEINSYRVY